MPILIKKNKYYYELVFHHQTQKESNQLQNNRNYLSESNKRAYKKLIDLAYTNDWTHFLTLTLDKTKLDRYNASQINRKLKNSLHNYKKRYDPDLEYIIRAEYHKDKAIHFHGLLRLKNKSQLHFNSYMTQKERNLKNNPHIRVFNWQYFYERFGRTWVQPLYNQEEFVALYITKYMNKENDRIYYMRYMRSRGLKEPEVLGELQDIDYFPYEFEDEYQSQFAHSFKMTKEQLELFLNNNAHLMEGEQYQNIMKGVSI